MELQALLVVLGLLQPVLLVVLVPRRWVGRAMLAWLALPLLGFLLVIASELATRDVTGNAGERLLFAAGVLGVTFGLAWVIGSVLAFALGLWLRRLFRPGEPPLRAAWPPQRPTPAAPPRPQRPAWTPGAPAGARIASLLSPDRRIGVGIAEVEWTAGQWVRTPRVEDRMTGRAVLDLWGSDWDAEARFPAPGQVWLGLRAYRGGGAFEVTLDLPAGTATLRAAGGAAPETVPIAEAAARLERAASAHLAALPPAEGPTPHRFAAWRTALAILVAAVAAIAGLVALTPDPPARPLDKVPSFTPPAIPEPPRITQPPQPAR